MFMRKSNMRKSKYDDLVGEIFSGAKLVETKMVDKTSKKTGKEYRVRRFWMTADGEHTLEIGIQSFKNESYFKRLDKITTKWIYTTFDEVVKEEPVKVKEEPSYLDEFEKRKMQRLIDDLHDACMYGHELANQTFERCVHNIKTLNNYSSFSGSTIYNSFEEYFNYWNTWYVERFIKEVEDSVESDWHYALNYSKLSEWIKEFSPKFKKVVEEEWVNVEQRRKIYQDQWRKDHWGSDWEQRWERENFGSQIDTRVNKYDEVFKDLTPKEAKRKMRELSKQLHPDVHPELDGTEFTAMHNAYERHMSRVA